jgi:fluoride exporter
MIGLSIYVAAGGAAGAIVRYLVSHRLNGAFPWGTLFINVGGSFLLGWYVAEKGEVILDSLYATGFLGALTTFSTLQFEAVALYKKSRKNVLIYLLLTYILGLIAAWTGFMAPAKIL